MALLGPRQAGKTTLAHEIALKRPALYLDLESEGDRARLNQPELFLAGHRDELVILDEVHRAPGLFPVLRGLIDRSRRQGRRAGLYLLLGSASFDLLRQSGESLAGRIRFLELGPFDATEAPAGQAEALWSRGGFPESLLAKDDARSLRWRRDFIRTYLEREIPQFGPRIAARDACAVSGRCLRTTRADCSTRRASREGWASIARPSRPTSTCWWTCCWCAGSSRGMRTSASGW